MTFIDGQVVLSRIGEYGANDRTELGIMYELYREEGNRNNLKITTNFGLKLLRNEWWMFSSAYASRTTMTHDEIKAQGVSLLTLLT